MSIYRGPILTVAAPHEVQLRLSDAAQSRIALNTPSAATDYLARRRETTAHLVDRGCRAVSGWCSATTLRRAMLIDPLEQ